MSISDWSSDVCSSVLSSAPVLLPAVRGSPPMIGSPGALFALGLFAAPWLIAGVWAVLRGVAMQRRSAFVAAQTERLAGLVEASPYLPVIVRGDWRIEASERLGRWRSAEHTSELPSL